MNDKVHEKGRQKLPTFGVGANMTKKYWLAIANNLEVAGYTFRDEERYRAVAIAKEGMKLSRPQTV